MHLLWMNRKPSNRGSSILRLSFGDEHVPLHSFVLFLRTCMCYNSLVHVLMKVNLSLFGLI